MLQNIKILKQYIKTKYGSRFSDYHAVEAWQERQVRFFLTKILPLSPFYRQYFTGLSIEKWRDWPTINKQMMMENFTELNTVGITKQEAFAAALRAEETRDFSPNVRKITVGLSSGTSGSRGIFIANDAERAKWAGAILAKVLPGSLFKTHKVAFFLRANSNLYKTVGNYRIKFMFFDLLNPMEIMLTQLNSFQPTILIAPPSMLRILAEALTAGLRIMPQKIVSVAEVLDPLDKVYLENAFQQVIHQIYQCTEGFLGTTCSAGILHLNEDLLVIQKEYIDDTRFVPIITDFTRVSQPMIRYRLDDILTEKKAGCSCGLPFTALEHIEGRCDDIFYLPARNQQTFIPIFPDFIRRAIIMADDSIQEYMVTQKDERTIAVAFISNQSDLVTDKIKLNLDKLWAQFNTIIPMVQFVDFEPKAPDKKLRRVERRFSVNEENRII